MLNHAYTGGKGFVILEDGAAALLALRALRSHLSGAMAEEADVLLKKHRINFDPDGGEADQEFEDA